MALVLKKIADEVYSELGGVDWDKLEQQTGLPREEAVYQVDPENTEQSGFFFYNQYIRDALARVDEQFKDVVLSFQVEEDPTTSEDDVVVAMQAWDAVQKDVTSIGNNLLTALRANAELLSEENALVLQVEQYRAIVSSTYLVCLYGAVLHAKGLMQMSDVAPEDIIASADNVTKTLDGLARLGEMGLLNPLKKKTEVVPTGAIPAGVAIAVLAVIGVGIIAWCIVGVVAQMEVNRNMRAICEDALKRGDSSNMERCVELLKINKPATSGGPFDFVMPLGQVALMIGAGYALFLLAPPIARMFKKKAAA